SLQVNRDAVFERIRDPDATQIAPSQMPSAHGDYYGQANNPSYLHSVSRLQYALLRASQKDAFDKDWERSAGPRVTAPGGLDLGAVEQVPGRVIFPGIGGSWLVANKSVGGKPFRLALGQKIGWIRLPGEARRVVFFEGGAVPEQMALPWEADFVACN